MNTMLLRGIRPVGKERCDLRIADGVIRTVAPTLLPQAGDTIIDGENNLALPGLVNGHTHVDKTLWSLPWHSHGAGPTVAERIRHERKVLADLNRNIGVLAGRLVRQMVSCGTTAIRTHVDIGPDEGLVPLQCMVELREHFAGQLDMQIVAFPQTGVMSDPAAAALLDEALRSGADLLGGIDPIGLDRDPRGQLDFLFDMASRHNKGLDIHLHEAGEMGAVSLDMIIDRTAQAGLNGQVVVSHAFCLGSVSSTRRDELIEGLRSNDIAVMSHGPGGGAPVPPVRTLADAGVRVFAGTDGVRDAWGPLNGPCLLERAFIISYLNGFRDDAGLELALDMVTNAGAQVMGLPNYGLAEGCRADIVLLAAENAAEAVAQHPPRRLVIKNGQVVARDGKCLLPPM